MIQSRSARDKEATFAQDKIGEIAATNLGMSQMIQPKTLVSVDMEGKVTWSEDVTPVEIMRSPYPDRVAILALWYATHPDQL
jgi:hypothetical protein